MGLSGLLINLVIGRAYQPEDLGAFNQVFAFYIVGAQFATLGLQYSALKFSSVAESDAEIRMVASSAILAALVLAFPASFLLFSTKDVLSRVFASPALGVGLAYAAPAMGLFAVNKVMISILNGLQHMKLFAFFQAIRFLLMLGFITYAAFSGIPGEQLPAALLVAECALTVGLLVSVAKLVGFGFADGIAMMRKHFSFGTRSFMGGAVTEMNSRVDVLMLGLFLSDSLVGLYSMAAMIAEGISQLAVVVRNNVNPLIARLYALAKFEDLRDLIVRTLRYSYTAMAIVIVVSIALYPTALSVLIGSDAYAESWLVFAVLSGGILLCAGYLPVDMILIQTGHPGWHTIFRTIAMLSNILLNLLLIPRFGLLGAAVATALSYVLSVLALRAICNRVLAERLL